VSIEEIVVYILTGLAAVVVVLTRLRLGKQKGGAGRVSVGPGLLNLHTIAGVLALAVWVAYLFAHEDTPVGGELAGIIGVALWWVVTITGLLILVRWIPSRGRHATSAQKDTWSEGPGLSILAHVGMLVGVLVFTYAYAESLV